MVKLTKLDQYSLFTWPNPTSRPLYRKAPHWMCYKETSLGLQLCDQVLHQLALAQPRKCHLTAPMLYPTGIPRPSLRGRGLPYPFHPFNATPLNNLTACPDLLLLQVDEAEQRGKAVILMNPVLKDIPSSAGIMGVRSALCFHHPSSNILLPLHLLLFSLHSSSSLL